MGVVNTAVYFIRCVTFDILYNIVSGFVYVCFYTVCDSSCYICILWELEVTKEK